MKNFPFCDHTQSDRAGIKTFLLTSRPHLLVLPIITLTLTRQRYMHACMQLALTTPLSRAAHKMDAFEDRVWSFEAFNGASCQYGRNSFPFMKSMNIIFKQTIDDCVCNSTKFTSFAKILQKKSNSGIAYVVVKDNSEIEAYIFKRISKSLMHVCMEEDEILSPM